MAKITQVLQQFEMFAPLAIAEEWDNSGLQVGDADRPVSSVLLALDLDAGIAQQAIDQNVDLIFTHHPFLFKGLRAIDGATYDGQIIMRLIENRIALYSAHTNLDFAPGGLLDLLCAKLGVRQLGRIAIPDEKNGIAYGTVPPTTLGTFIEHIKTVLQIPYVRYHGDLEKPIEKVAVCNGGGGDLGALASREGCDVYVTGDFKYHTAQSAVKDGMAIVDAGHFETEQIFIELMASFFKKTFPDIQVITPKEAEPILKTI